MMKPFIAFILLVLTPLLGRSQTDQGMGRPLPLYKPGVALMIHGGTAGFGVDVGKSVFRQLSLRAGANLFTYEGKLKAGKSSDELQMGFDYTLKLSSFNLLADFYPFKRAAFRLTAGAYYNQNQISFFGKPTQEVRFNDVVFSVDQIGTVDGKANFSKVAPYLGIGWGHPFLNSRLKIMADIGVFYQQSPTITFVTTGMLEPSSDQGQVIENNLKPLKYYPVVNLGISYRIVSTRF
jgi:hypothetical protein